MKASERLLLVVAVAIGLFGLLIIVGAIVSISNPKPHESIAGDIALLILIGVAPLAFAVWLFVRTRTNAQRRSEAMREQLVLHLAGRHQGVLTIPQLAEESGMSLEQAKEMLDRLYRKSFAQLSLADSGEEVYTFHL